MKNKLVILLLIAMVMLGGCTQTNMESTTENTSEEVQITEWQTTEKQTTEEQTTEMPSAEVQTTESATEVTTQEQTEEATESETLDESIYIGEYLDYDNNEPNLEIAKGDDGKYIVQIGIFRLTTLSDGIGELTPEGMVFTATDAEGNPISGIITVENRIATVKFTDSTWSLLENGSSFEYSKSSDTPNVWTE